jgi:hypothetical protein
MDADFEGERDGERGPAGWGGTSCVILRDQLQLSAVCQSVKAMKGSYDPAKRTDLAAAPEPILVPSRLDPPNVRLYSSGAAVYEQTVDSIYFAA